MLVTGAAGGVGVAAVQLGVASGVTVVASVRDPNLRTDVASFGAEAIAPDEHAAHGPYDVILEMFPRANLAEDITVLATGGRIHIVSLVGGPRVEVDFSDLMARRGSLHSSGLKTRGIEAVSDVARRVEAEVVPLLASGTVRVPVFATYPLSEAAAAYKRFVEGGKFGKIILCPEAVTAP